MPESHNEHRQIDNEENKVQEVKDKTEDSDPVLVVWDCIEHVQHAGRDGRNG
jgi:hypothetical protein